MFSHYDSLVDSSIRTLHGTVGDLTNTVQDNKGIGSSDTVQTTTSTHAPTVIPHDENEIEPVIHSAITRPDDMFLSACPFGLMIVMEIITNSTHPTLGLEIDERNMKGRLELINCAKSTPAHKMKRWRSTLRNSNILEVESEPIASIDQLKAAISDAKIQGKSSIKIMFATEE